MSYYTFSDELATYIYSSHLDGTLKEEHKILSHDFEEFDDFTFFFCHAFKAAFKNLDSIICFPCFDNTYFFVKPYVQHWWAVSVHGGRETLDRFEVLWDTRNLTYTIAGKTYQLDEELWEYISIVDAIADSCNQYQ